jgi:serine phosphatase RsbU (regulator of sigma subunit)
VCEQVLQRVAAHIGSPQPQDDITLLVVQVA